jgi:TusA-related sulfurtransferase
MLASCTAANLTMEWDSVRPQPRITSFFILTPNGGIVQVTANDPKNTEQIETIQMHMKHITEMFSEGNFSIPHFVHDQTPPGVPTMKELKDAIRYSAEPLSNGGRIKIETTSPEGIAAVHEFLRFQIKDHQTGDPTTVQK